MQGRELTHTTISTTLIRGENKHILQYLKKINIRERTNTYHIIYKTIKGRELTLTRMFTKLFRGVIHNIYKTIQGREIKHTQYL
jgi:hypothetical protein